jgi:biotin synthase
LSPQPESTPISGLVAVEGATFENETSVDLWDMIRMVASKKIVLAERQVRLFVGKTEMSRERQAMGFFTAANFISVGDKLLTTSNLDVN